MIDFRWMIPLCDCSSGSSAGSAVDQT